VAREKSSGLLTGCNSGSTHTWEQTSVSKVAVRSLTSVCRKEGKPPLEQDKTCSTEKVTPQAQNEGEGRGGHPYLKASAS